MANISYLPHPAVIERDDGTFTTYSKTCTKCRTTKLLDEYSAAKEPRDGRKSWCKSCVALSTRGYKAVKAGAAVALVCVCEFCGAEIVGRRRSLKVP